LGITNVLLPHDPDDEAPRKKRRTRLPDAAEAYAIVGWEDIDKEQISKDIGEGRWRKYGKPVVLKYCDDDVKASCELLRRMLRGCGRELPPIDPALVMHWSNYSAKAVALMQAKGMPIDMRIWNGVQENKLVVIDALRRDFDPSYYDDDPIYDAEGSWETKRFERWLIRNGIDQWEKLPSGHLKLDGDAFKAMSHVKAIANLHALRDAMGVVARARLPIGRDGRNRPKLLPFHTATGRNAHSASLFNFHAGMRGLMLFNQGTIGAYLDWKSQEVGIAAALSGDPQLTADYHGDIYHALALLRELTNEQDPVVWKNKYPDMRQDQKPIQLGIGYGMGVRSLARSIDRSVVVSSEILIRHGRRYPRYWQWREATYNRALLEREIRSRFGWTLRITHAPNERTLFNFPCQSNGAEMLRRAAVNLCEAAIVPSMLIHDGILIEVENEKEIEHAKEIMREAGLFVCNGLEIGVDDQTMRRGDKTGGRFTDKRSIAKKMWATITGALRKIGAI
jgi:hypothetical protein